MDQIETNYLQQAATSILWIDGDEDHFFHFI